MIEKRLGKIDFVEFGSMKDYPFQLGLQLGFSMSGSGVMDGGKYTVNMSPDCHWEIGTRHTNLAESLDRVAKILNDVAYIIPRNIRNDTSFLWYAGTHFIAYSGGKIKCSASCF
mgnify:CR=1 FL=1